MGDGKFYVGTIGDGYKPLMMLENPSVNTIEDSKEYADDKVYISQLASCGLIEISVKPSKEVLNALFGIHGLVCNCCPNKKIVHLAKHARKRKTRKKNFNRSIRILEKEVKKRSDDTL